MAMTVTATFQPDYGFVRVVAAGCEPGFHVYRLPPLFEGWSARLPAHNYSADAQDQVYADYLAPMGATFGYGIRREGDLAYAATVTVSTPANVAYLRHLFYPTLGLRVRVARFDDRRPSRLTTYAVSGQRNAAATWDMRAGREATLEIAVEGFGERQTLEHIINSGSPVSLAMCSGLGNEPGIFAVGDVDFRRWGSKDRWVATLPLTEVDLPRILGELSPADIPGTSYNDRAVELGLGKTYTDAAARWGHYYQAGA